MVYSTQDTTTLSSILRKRTMNVEVINEVIEFTTKYCKDNSLDYEKVTGELVRSLEATKEVRNVSAFVRAVLTRLDLEKYKYKSKRITVWTFHFALVNTHHFDGKTWELNLLYNIEEKIYEMLGEEDARTLIQTNHAILQYCIANNLKTFKDFIDLLLRSKLVKRTAINVKELKEKSKKEIEEWDKLIAEIEEEKGEDTYGEDKFYRTFSENSIDK